MVVASRLSRPIHCQQSHLSIERPTHLNVCKLISGAWRDIASLTDLDIATRCASLADSALGVSTATLCLHVLLIKKCIVHLILLAIWWREISDCECHLDSLIVVLASQLHCLLALIVDQSPVMAVEELLDIVVALRRVAFALILFQL